MKKNKNRFLLGFFFGMLAMAVVVGGVGTGLYFANQNTSGKTISEKTSQKLDYINKLIDAKFLNKVNESDLEDGIPENDGTDVRNLQRNRCFGISEC